MNNLPGFPFEKFQLRSNSILEHLTAGERIFFEEQMLVRTFKKKQAVFVEGTAPSGIFFLKSGKVKKFKSDRDGKEQIIYICSPGELFGYPALLSEETYSDSATALEDSQIGFLPKAQFLQLLQQSAVFSNLLLKNLSHEFGVLENSIVTFAHKTVRERLALALLILKGKYSDQKEKDQVAEITLSREDLANMVGTAVETLVRLLHEFKDENLVETKGRIIKVLDAKKLVEVANFY
jgi:CRP-like cAMP-binding protein